LCSALRYHLALAPARSPLRTSLLSLVLVVLLAVLALRSDGQRLRAWVSGPVDPVRPTVVLIVLDTFRADWPSVCGGPVPTPTLEELAARQQGHFSCNAVTPGAWTLPSHASYFTGKPVLEHGAHSASGHGATFWPPAVPLDGRHATLAEEYGALGYQSVSLSGNPLLAEATGLNRGFEKSFAPEAFFLEGQDWLARLDGILLALDPERPLFLVLNLSDAHSPWEAIPAGQSWISPLPAPTQRWEGFYPGPGETDVLEDYAMSYQWGMHRADRSLGQALKRLEASGWYLPGRDRLALTTDHGEVFGEEGFLGHTGSLLQSNVGGLLYVEGVDIPNLPDPVSAMEVHPLLQHGALGGLPVESIAMPAQHLTRVSDGAVGHEVWLGHWEGGGRWIWRDGEVSLNGRTVDERGPLKPLITSFQAYAPNTEMDGPALEAMLKAAGYLE
jgi:hypothetical protein